MYQEDIIFQDWFDKSKLSIKYLSSNPNINAIAYLERLLEKSSKNMKDLDWDKLSRNESAMSLIKKYPKKIVWTGMSGNSNPEALKLLKENLNKLSWPNLSQNSNPEALKMLKENPNKISWPNFSKNSNPEAIKMLRQNPSKIDIHSLAQNSNPEATEILKEYINMLSDDDWNEINANTSNINFLNEYPEHIDSYSLSQNPNATEYLIENPDKINWRTVDRNPKLNLIIEKFPELYQANKSKLSYFKLSENPSIFKQNYDIQSRHNLTEALNTGYSKDIAVSSVMGDKNLKKNIYEFLGGKSRKKRKHKIKNKKTMRKKYRTKNK